jgi:hypothetical protein
VAEHTDSQSGLSAVTLAALWSIAVLVAVPLGLAPALLPAGLVLLVAAFEPRSALLRAGLGLAAPLWLFWKLHHRALGAWWLGDDPCHLVQSLDHGLWRPYVEPVGYFLTPSLLLSLGSDLRLFGLDPAPFYLHQLVAFSLVVAVAYGLLRVWLPVQAAALAVTLFVASAPAWAVARQLMNRHYLEGLGAALAALWLYHRATTTDRASPAVLGALLYLVAASAKEVFVPLVLLLPFLGAGTPRVRRRRALPFALAAVVYVAWRLAVLGLGGSWTAYGSLSGESGGTELLERIAGILGWPQLPALVLPLALLAGSVLLIARTSRSAAFGSLVAVVVLAAPLLPVLGRLEPRHLFLPAAAAAAALTLALWRATGPMPAPGRGRLRSAVGLLLLLATFAATARAPFATHLEASVRRHELEGRALLAGGFDGLLVTEVEHSHHLQCLTRLARALLGRDDGPGFCGDPCYCAMAYPTLPLGAIATDGAIVPVETPPETCSVAATLEIEMVHDLDRRRLTWSFGPYRDGAYSALLISPAGPPGVSIPVPLPRQGALTTSDSQQFVIRHDSPAGWSAYSEVYRIEPGGRARVVE